MRPTARHPNAQKIHAFFHRQSQAAAYQIREIALALLAQGVQGRLTFLVAIFFSRSVSSASNFASANATATEVNKGTAFTLSA
jgi:hypothetical protein